MEEDEERITRAQANHRQLMNRLDFVVGLIREQDRRLELMVGRGAGSGTEDGRGATPEQGALAEARKRARRRSG